MPQFEGLAKARLKVLHMFERMSNGERAVGRDLEPGRFVKANEAESAEAEPAVAVEAKGTNKVAAESGTARARHADQLRDGTLVLKDRLRVGLLKKNIYQHGCLRQRAILFAKRKSEKKVLEKLKAVSVASEIQVDLKDVSLKQKKALYDRFRLVRRNGQWYGPTWEYVWHTDKSVQVLKTDMLSDELAQRRKTQLQIEGGKRSWEDELEVILKKWGSDVKYWEGEILPSIVAQLSDPHFYSTWRRVKKERELGEKVGGNAVDAVAVEEGKLDVVEKDGLDFGETRGDPAAGAVVEIVGEGDDSFEMNKPVVLPGLTDASIFDGKDPKAKEKKEPEKNPLLPPPPAPPAKPNVTREWLNAEKPAAGSGSSKSSVAAPAGEGVVVTSEWLKIKQLESKEERKKARKALTLRGVDSTKSPLFHTSDDDLFNTSESESEDSGEFPAAPLLAASTAIQKLLDVDDDAVERVMAALSYRYALGDNSTENAVQECTEIVSRFKASWQKNRPNSSNSELADHIVRFCEEKSAGALNKKKQEVAGGRGGGIVVNKSVAAVHGGSKEQQPDGAEAVTSGSSGKAEVLAEKSSASGERKQEVLPVPARGAYAADVDQGQKGGKKTAEKSGEIERPRDKKSDGKIKNNADDGHNSKWNPHPAETDYKNYDQHSYREYGRNTDRAPAWCQWRDGGWKKGAGDWKSENDRNEYPLWDAGRENRGTPMTIPSGAASVAGGETPILIPDSLKSNNAAARSQDSGISPLVTDAGGGGPPVVEQKKVTSVSENVSASGVTLPLDATKKKKKEADEEPSASAAKKAAAPQSIMPTVSTELKPFGMSLVVLDDDEVVVDKKPSENSDKKPSCSQPPPVVKMQLHDAKQPAPALRLVVEPARVPAGRIVRKQMKPPSRSGSPIKRGGAPSLIASLDLVPVLQRSVLVAGTGTGTPSRHTIGGAKASGASRSGVADTATGAGAPSAAPSPAAAAGAKKEGNLTLTGVPAPTPNAGTIGLSLLNPSILSANPSAVSASLKSRASLLRIRTPPSYSTKKYVKTGEAGAAIAKPKKPVDYNLFNPPARPVDPASPAKASVQAAKRDEVPTATASAAVKKGNTPKPRTSSSPSTSSAHRAAPTANKKRGGTKMTLGVEGSNANVAGRTAAKNDEYWVDLYVVGEPKLNGTYMPQKGIDKENLTYWLNAGKNTKICSHFLAPKGPEGASCWMFRDATTDAPLLRSSLHRRNQNEKDKWAERCFYIPSAVQAWFTLDKTQGIKQHTSLMIAEGDEISKATRVFGVGTEAGAANKAGAATLPVAPQKMNTKKFAKTGTKKPATKPEAAKAAVTSKTKAAASTNITIKKDINSSVNDGSLFSKPLLEAQQSGATTTAGAGEKKPSKPSGQQFPFLTKSNRPAKIAATPPHIALRDNGEADGASKVSSLQKSSKVHGLLKAKTVGKQKAAKASATQPSTAVKKSGTKAESREKAVARKVENRRAQALIEPPPESSDSEA
eukprot:g3272.t1